MSQKQKNNLIRLLVGAVLLSVLLWEPVLQGLNRAARLVLFLIPYFVVGWDVLWKALRNIKSGQFLDENFLMSIATVGAFASGEYPEGVAVMLFYQVGELFQSVAVGRSRKSIAALMDIRPDYANLERDGQLLKVDPEQVQVGDIIVIRPGERIPLDGTILDGASALDTSALTGESMPRDVSIRDEVVNGCINLTGALRVQVSRPFSDSTVAKILDLVENSSVKKARAEQFITKFARIYTPAVVFAAVSLVLLPPLLFGGSWTLWFHRALIFLVVSCPCALVISVPLSFFGGIGAASAQGILVKGGNYLEALSTTDIVVLDKTGTLTQGTFSVVSIHPRGMTEEELVNLAALAEQMSKHPIAQSILASCAEDPDPDRISSAEEFAGEGIRVTADGQDIWAGNPRLMDRAGIVYEEPAPHTGTVIHVAMERNYAGYLIISDQVRPEAADALEQLKELGVQQMVMLTGDTQSAAQAMADELKLSRFCAQLLPGGKVEQVERLLAEKRPRETLAFVGDGINDAPVLARADVGIAMGALGSDAAIEAADIVLMDDDLAKLPLAISIARKTLRIVRQNVVFALGVKFLVLLLAAVGMANMWMAVFADVGVSVLAILNACRMLRTSAQRL